MNIKTIDIRGKAYVTVAERVKLVHAEREAFEIVESTAIPVADRWLWRAVIRVNERQYIGTAEVKLNAAKHLPDGTNPFECAETSAIGRALGFAGLGSVESIASAEEVIQAMVEQERPAPTYDASKPATESQLSTIDRLHAQLGMQSLDETSALTFGECAQMLRDLSKRIQGLKRAG